MQGYCSECKKNVEIKDPVLTKLRNGEMAYVGKCPNDNTEIIKRRN